MGMTQAVRSWWRGTQRPSPAPRRPSRTRGRIGFETLEDRTVPSSTSLTDLVSIDRFTPSGNNAYQVAGTINVPGVGPQAFTSTANVTSQRNAGPNVVLNLSLQAVDLNLLGLHVHLDPINLSVIASPGGGLLGNLLGSRNHGHQSSALYSRNLGFGLNDVFQLTNTALSADPLSHLVGIGTPLNAQSLSDQLKQAGVQAGTTPVTVLDLTVQKLDLNVLGLRVLLSPQTPLHLTITADPNGGLLGQLLAQVSHALDNSGNGSPTLTKAELTSILNSLTGGLLSGLTSTGLPAGTPTLGGASGTTAASHTANRHLASLFGPARTILSLDIGPIHLNLLGLHVDTSEIVLKITAVPGPGNLLGNLLGGLGGPTFGNARGGIGSITGLAAGTNLGGLTSTSALNATALLDYLVGQVAAATGPKSTMTTTTSRTVPILTLTLGPLDLNLLGLRIQLYSPPMNPVTLSITAVTGPGNLLGNLLADIANLLNPPA